MKKTAARAEVIRVLIADDHNLFRAGVRGLLKTFGGMDVTGEATNGHEAVALAAEQRPDVLLMDVGMPGLNGIEAAERVRAATPTTRVIILSMHTGEEHVTRAADGAARHPRHRRARPVCAAQRPRRQRDLRRPSGIA